MKRSRIHTIHNRSNNDGKARPSLLQVKHISGLPREQDALDILNRLRMELLEIVQCQNWNVMTLNELCCCSGKKRKTKKRTNDNNSNVWGYNVTTFRQRQKEHRIHIRLRHPHNHDLLLEYDDIVGTMCHELAHCVHGNHSVQFYRLMEAIQKQHALYVRHNIVYDAQGFPMSNPHHQNSQIYTFDKNPTNHNGSSRNRLRDAAEQRRTNQKSSSTYGATTRGTNPVSTTLPNDPKEAAKLAALQRASIVTTDKDEQQLWCLPCSSSDILQIWDTPKTNQNNQPSRKNTWKNIPTKSNFNNSCIELLSIDSDGDDNNDDKSLNDPTNHLEDMIDLTDVSSPSTIKIQTNDKNMNASKKAIKETMTTQSCKESRIQNRDIPRNHTRNNDTLTRNNMSPISIEFVQTNHSNPNKENIESIPCHIITNEKKDTTTTWTCQQCTFLNNPLVLACKACRTMRPNDPSSSSVAQSQKYHNSHDKENNHLKWNCSQCTFQNHKTWNSCQMCHHLKSPTKKRRRPLTSSHQNQVEKETSKQQFHGFDIYSGFRSHSGSMKHLT